MASRRAQGRDLDGVLVLDKSGGMSSNQALQKAKRLFNAAKAGHTGALDPLATGVLPLCFGEATKFSQFLLDADKTYRVRACFGVTTNTLDAEGEIQVEKDASSLAREQVAAALDSFRGDILQVPPMFSALKRDGKPLYQLARQGLEVEREPRQVTIHSLEMTGFWPGARAEAEFEASCSKGTYIRTLIADMGDLLGVGAHVTALRRTRAGPYTESMAVSIDQLEAELSGKSPESLDHHLLPMDSPAQSLPRLDLDQQSVRFFMQGQAVMSSEAYRFAAEGDIVRVFAEGGDFLGVAEVSEARVLPRRLVRH